MMCPPRRFMAAQNPKTGPALRRQRPRPHVRLQHRDGCSGEMETNALSERLFPLTDQADAQQPEPAADHWALRRSVKQPAGPACARAAAGTGDGADCGPLNVLNGAVELLVTQLL
jgi:hypothetical protein